MTEFTLGTSRYHLLSRHERIDLLKYCFSKNIRSFDVGLFYGMGATLELLKKDLIYLGKLSDARITIKIGIEPRIKANNKLGYVLIRLYYRLAGKDWRRKSLDLSRQMSDALDNLRRDNISVDTVLIYSEINDNNIDLLNKIINDYGTYLLDVRVGFCDDSLTSSKCLKIHGKNTEYMVQLSCDKFMDTIKREINDADGCQVSIFSVRERHMGILLDLKRSLKIGCKIERIILGSTRTTVFDNRYGRLIANFGGF